MRSSSFSRSAGSLFLLCLASPVAAQDYKLVENWEGDGFLDYFKFYTGADPTNGYVNYVEPQAALDGGLVKVTDAGTVYIGVDHKTTLDPHGKGRDSVRVGTKKYYDKSLVIADIAHMPASVCGTWPAFWSVGREWPGDGEIDILEGVNLQDHNEVVMHTSGTCSLKDEGMSGAVNATGCGEALGPVGCVIEGEQGSYGTSFNRGGGGIYAMEWTEEHLKIWFFPRHSIPRSISSGKPDVNKFGIPMALVKDGCDVANSFKPQSFVFDTTFCGDWAGGVFGKSGCPMTDADSFQSCHNFVANNPSKFEETYWDINSVKVYQTGVEGIEIPSTTHTHASVVEPAPVQTPVQEYTTYTSIIQAPTTTISTSTKSETMAEMHSSMIIQPEVTPNQGATAVRPVGPAASTPPLGAFPGTTTQVSVEQSPAPQSPPPVEPTTVPAEPSTVTVHEYTTPPKPSTTRYITQLVTHTSTVCTASPTLQSTSPNDHVSAPWFWNSHSHSHSPPPAAAPTSSEPAPAASIEPPTSWGGQQAQGAGVQQSPQNSEPAPPAGSSNAQAVNSQAPSHVRPVAASSSHVVGYHATPTSSAIHSAAAAHASPVSSVALHSASHVAAVQPSQHSTPVIPKPSGGGVASGSSAASGSQYRAAPTQSSTVFTGAGNKLSAKAAAWVAVFAMILLA